MPLWTESHTVHWPCRLGKGSSSWCLHLAGSDLQKQVTRQRTLNRVSLWRQDLLFFPLHTKTKTTNPVPHKDHQGPLQWAQRCWVSRGLPWSQRWCGLYLEWQQEWIESTKPGPGWHGWWQFTSISSSNTYSCTPVTRGGALCLLTRVNTLVLTV